MSLSQAHVGKLLHLHETIAVAKQKHDVDMLQRVVDVIEESGLYRLDEHAIDFNLVRLDLDIVERLLAVLGIVSRS
jgi:hypothetical protein